MYFKFCSFLLLFSRFNCC